MENLKYCYCQLIDLFQIYHYNSQQMLPPIETQDLTAGGQGSGIQAVAASFSLRQQHDTDTGPTVTTDHSL